MPDTYIFDLDDTIIDTSIYARMYNELLNQLVDGLKISRIGLQQEITKMKEETGLQRVDTFELCRRLNSTELYYDVLTKYARHTYTLKTKSIPAIFRKIKEARKRIGVVSNSQKRTIGIFLDRFNLSEHVDFIESGDKKTVLFWVTLEKRHNLDKTNTLVIDNSDEILDIAGHVGYKTLNVENITDIEKFSF